MKAKKQIKLILKEFDFKRVYQIMNATNWTWGGMPGDDKDFESRVPTIDELKKEAERLLFNLKNEKLLFCTTGGFFALKMDGRYCLFFGIDYVPDLENTKI